MAIVIPVSPTQKSLLNIIQNVSNELGLAQVAQVVGNTDNQMRQLLQLANREGQELAKRANNGGWQVLRREYTFNTQAGVEAYAFPPDLQYIIPQTEWDRSFRWQLLGPMSAQEWQVLKSGISPVGPRRRFRIMQGMIYINPVPTDSTSIEAFEYLSKCWCTSASGAPQDHWQADTDLSVLPSDVMELGIIWRFLQKKGLSFEQEYQDYERAVEQAMARDKSARTLPLNAQATGARLLNSDNVPDTGFGA